MGNEINLKLVQSELLSMMKDIHALCVENGVEYSLTGGSLLGAVRESGFIPWDDDMDIMVDRKNYNRLCEAIKKCKGYEMGRGPWLQHIRPVAYSSAVVPFVDVFILDKLPDKAAQAKLKIFLLRMLQGMLKEEVEYEGFSFVYKVCIFVTHLIGKLFSRRIKLKWYDKVSRMGDSSAAEYISITNDSFGLLKLKYKADLLTEFEACSFEDTQLMIIKKHAEYLSFRYGADYMTPPPVEERVWGQHVNRPKVSDERIGV